MIPEMLHKRPSLFRKLSRSGQSGVSLLWLSEPRRHQGVIVAGIGKILRHQEAEPWVVISLISKIKRGADTQITTVPHCEVVFVKTPVKRSVVLVEGTMFSASAARSRLQFLKVY